MVGWTVEERMLMLLTIVLVIVGFLLQWSLASRRYYIDQYHQIEIEMNTLKADHAALQSRYDSAQKTAEASMTRVQAEANATMRRVVPKTCDQAVRWGYTQASRIRT